MPEHRSASSGGLAPRRRTFMHFLIAVACLAGFACLPAAANATSYYVSCSGNDSNNGTSTSTPWKSLSKANNASLRAGDSLNLLGGCQWTGPLNARWTGTAAAPIQIRNYGSGMAKIVNSATNNVTITGAYQVITGIYTSNVPKSYDSQCQNAPLGTSVGFRFLNGANHNTVQSSEADNQEFGIFLDWGSSYNNVLHNTLKNNNVRDSNLNADGGAVGINVFGDYNRIGFNTISGSDVCSRFYGRDGSAVEMYGGRNNMIDHNIAIDDNTFTELGNPRTAYNTYAYNEFRSSLTKATFLVTRGSGDTRRGPVVGTKVYNTTVYMTGAQSYAIQCTAGCSSSILYFHNNIVWAQDRVGYADHAFDEGNNVYWSPGGPKVWFPISSTSRKADPRYVNPGAGDFHLGTGSPAVNLGTSSVLSLFTTDLLGTALPLGGVIDAGAIETR
jgi:hypothetical protein